MATIRPVEGLPERALPLIPTVKMILGDRYSEDLQAAFPDIPAPFVPVGMYVLVQLRTSRRVKKLANGKHFFYSDDTRDAEKYRTQTALVRAMGPAAYKRRDDLKDWPEGNWCFPGDFVRVPMYGGDRVGIDYIPKVDNGTTPEKEEALFMTIKDLDIIGIIPGDPLAIKTLV